eukprot:CAMPEP_0174286462 /NCGR_PEP_ID=MMETSP0809-20121228/11961_1 /TAXON_ID=73025 ORGANISM="Eutreptiella gymnastica-like, Strain CCMP1594" /NCGR_SAMPLE_ID=MMETSP0809 /ASSEMBLY_ACC=CAM_ASM_000658 /LENGTH=236 /DNA_ID=CAMNT_0015382551 /DNA_START=41 /DNA_END=751 /DNA_ORIENTATION=-
MAGKGWGQGKGGKGAAWNSQPPSTTICVVNLPDDISQREFRLIFKFAGGVERVIINMTKTGKQVGYARFSSLPEAQAAMEYLNGYPLDEEFPEQIKVFMSTTQLNDTKSLPNAGMKRTAAEDWSNGPPIKYAKGGKGGKGAGKGASQGVASSTSVYVGGIPHDWDETMIQRMFETSGAITQINLTKGRNPIGNIGFVHYGTPEEAQIAIQNMNGYAVDETRYLTVRANTSPKCLSA